MRNNLPSYLILFLCGLLLTALNVFSQNKYFVHVIQPDSLHAPVLIHVSTTLNDKNTIVWAKPENKNIQTIGIYRESLQYPNKWEILTRVNAQTETNYLDQTSEPLKQTYRYRVSGFDKCGFESTLSVPHRTIKLFAINGANQTSLLAWNAYEGKNIRSYKVFRGLTADELTQIDSTLTTQYADTSRTLPKGEIFYRIEADLGENTQDSYKSAPIKNYALSNISTIYSFTGNSDTTYNSGLRIIPNPLSAQSMVIYPNLSGKPYEVSIFDLMGNPVFSETVNTYQFEIKRDQLKEGMYLIRVKGDHLFEGKLSVGNRF